MLFRTRDHTLSDLSEDEISSLGVDEESPVSRSRVFMCLGGSNTVDPVIGVSAVDKEDWFMLCSDGVWSAFDQEELVQSMVHSSRDIPDASRLVHQAINKLGDQADNSSLIFASAHGKSQSPGLISRLFARH